MNKANNAQSKIVVNGVPSMAEITEQLKHLHDPPINLKENRRSRRREKFNKKNNA